MTAGWTLADIVTPYVLARAFGGPVYWRIGTVAQTGTDTHHDQLGAGAVAAITSAMNLFVEGVPLGERAVTGGLSLAF